MESLAQELPSPTSPLQFLWVHSGVAMSARFVRLGIGGADLRETGRQKLRGIRREDGRTRTEPVPSLLVATPSYSQDFELNLTRATQHGLDPRDLFTEYSDQSICSMISTPGFEVTACLGSRHSKHVCPDHMPLDGYMDAKSCFVWRVQRRSIERYSSMTPKGYAPDLSVGRLGVPHGY